MRFCPIAPTAYLERYAGRSNTHLVLAQLAGSDPRYFEYYRGRVQAGDVVILDNGAYEGKLVDTKELMRISEELEPTVLVVPDKIGDYNESQRLMEDFYNLFYADFSAYAPQLMLTLQQDAGADIFTWAAQYVEYRTMAQWIGLPRVLGWARPQLIHGLQILGLWDGTVKHHALGMNAGSLDELKKLAELGVYSCDSSAPVWRGLNGFGLDSTTLWPDFPFDAAFEAGGPDVEDLADFNLTKVLHICNSPSARR